MMQALVRHVFIRACCAQVNELCSQYVGLHDSSLNVLLLFIYLDFINMPRLSVSDRDRIIGEIRAGIKPREVALRYNVNRSTVHRMMNTFTQEGDVVDHKRSGYPRVTNAREDRAMLMENRRNPYRTAAETARATIDNNGRQISDRTVRLRL